MPTVTEQQATAKKEAIVIHLDAALRLLHDLGNGRDAPIDGTILKAIGPMHELLVQLGRELGKV